MAHVYLAYKHNTTTGSLRDVGATIAKRLESSGFTVWADKTRLQPGENWNEAIDEAIRGSFAMVLLITPESQMSTYVTYEWAFALGNNLPVIPIIVKPTPLHPRLAMLQYLDFTADGPQAWERLVRRLTELEAQHAVGTVRVAKDAPLSVRQAVVALESHDIAERKAAVENLALNSHPAARQALIDAVQHVMYDVRVQAALRLAALTHYTDNRCVPGLIDALRDKDPEMRYAAAEALEILKDETAVPELIRALRDDTFGVRPRRAAAKALESIGTPEANAAVRQWKYG